jgi:hypothetical protein
VQEAAEEKAVSVVQVATQKAVTAELLFLQKFQAQVLRTLVGAAEVACKAVGRFLAAPDLVAH